MPRPLTRPDRPAAARSVALLVVLTLVGGVAATAYTAFRIWQRGTIDEARPADAIVVLGAAEYDGTPSAVFAARLDHAVALYRQGLARYLVVTGGGREGDRTTEAAVARIYAEDHGVPASAILSEDRGRSTLESLEGVVRIMRANGLRSAVFVSDRSHMLRVLRMARDLGITAYGSPTATSPADATLERRVDAMLHELGALAWYGILSGSGPETAAGSRP